jgi:Transposase and inactivated derivatives, IS30 family
MAKKLNKHLSLDDRKIIESALNNAATRTAIAQTLGKDKSTICKEVKKHKFISTSTYGRNPNGVYDCVHLSECDLKFCANPCERYKMTRCSRRDRTVGVCNGCEQYQYCKKTRYRYDAQKAQSTYTNTLSDSRIGVDLTSSQAKALGDILKPLINQGQSVYAIIKNNPDISLSEKTIYNYISNGVFSQSGLYDIDLRLKTKRKPIKKKIVSKPRENRSFLKGRSYNDFKNFLSNHPSASVVEMDTVYNDGSNGPFIQTFQFVEFKFMLAFLHHHRSAHSMTCGVHHLKSLLGDFFFNKFVNVILTDRGMEFSNASAIEDTGCLIFYCDPMCSWQKPHVENNHLLLRYILPKKTDLASLGLHSQLDLDLICSHINSYPRKELFGKSPIDCFLFFNHDDQQIFNLLNIKKIDPNSIVLNPSLIRK